MVESNIVSFKNFTLKKHEQAFYEVEIFDNCEFGIGDLKLLVEAQKELGKHKLPVLILCGKYASASVDFLNYLSKNVNDPYSKADAFVINSISQKLLANFYNKVVKPERPTRFFNDREEACNWLKQYI